MCPSGRTRLLAGLLGLAAAFMFPPEARGQTDLPPGWEGGLFEVRVPGLASRTLPVLLNPRGVVLLPVAEVLELTGSAVTQSPDGALALTIAPDGTLSHLVLDSGLVVTRGRDSLALHPSDHRRMEGRLLLGTDALAAWLDAQVALEWEFLTVTLTRDPPFPAQIKAQRLAVRGRTLRALSWLPDPLAELDAPLPASSGLGLLSWSVSSSEIDPREASTLSLHLGGALLGGDLTVGGAGTAGRRTPDRFEYGTATYRRTFPHGSLVRDLFAGDVTTRGPLGHSIRGLLVTNRPRTLPSVFDRVFIDPDVPPGWEYEVYRDGQLVGFSDPLQPGPVTVPVDFGRTDLEVRMYGPAGQETVVSSLYHVPTSQLPRGRVEYSAGAGTCLRLSHCRYLGYLDVDYGVTRTLTLGLGGEALEDSLGTRAVRPSASVSYAPSGGWLAQVQGVADSHVDALLDYSGTGRVNLSLRGSYFSSGSGRLVTTTPSDGRWRLSGNLSSSIGRLSVAASGPRGEPAEFLTGSLGRITALGYLQASYERDRYGGPGSWGGRLISGWTDRYVAGSTGTLAARVREGRLHNVEAGLTATLTNTTFWSGFVRWIRGTEPGISLSVSRRLGFGRFHSLVRTNRSGTTRANYTLAGTLAYQDRSFSAIPDHGVGLSGVRGRVFLDRDGNGEMDPGEAPAPAIDVSAGHQRGRTDERGEYRIWGVSPYEPIVVQMDTVRSFVPDWAPTRARVVLRTVPNLYRDVDIPLVPTKEILGALVAGPGILTVGGVTLQLENSVTGDVETVLTYSDGTFYVPRLRAGRYRLRPAPASLEALDAVAVPTVLVFEIDPADQNPFLELPPLRLERRPAGDWPELGTESGGAGVDLVDRAARKALPGREQ